MLAQKRQTAVERNTALQAGVRREAPAGGAGFAKWKIPAGAVFPFPMGRKRVLLEAGNSSENTENTGKMTK